MRPLRKSEKQWLFPASVLHHTPSQDAGMSYEAELQERAYTIDCIRSLARRTNLTVGEDPYLDNGGRAKGVLTVAATLVHRFYMRRSMQDFPPPILAATILFISSKIEEESIKLRHIVNFALEKFENATQDKMWYPAGENGPLPSPEYRRWEEEILACEEIAHEALCFDMTVDQPWPVYLNGVSGLDKLWADGAGPAGFGELIDVGLAAKPVEEPMEEGEEGEVMEPSQADVDWRDGGRTKVQKGDARVNERAVLVLGWALLNELYLYPLPVLYHPTIIAFACLKLVLGSLLPKHDTLRSHIAELAPRFGLDAADPEGVADGSEKSDRETVEDCINDISDLVKIDLMIKDVAVLKNVWNGFLNAHVEK